jgi:hypothetical protein
MLDYTKTQFGCVKQCAPGSYQILIRLVNIYLSYLGIHWQNTTHTISVVGSQLLKLASYRIDQRIFKINFDGGAWWNIFKINLIKKKPCGIPYGRNVLYIYTWNTNFDNHMACFLLILFSLGKNTNISLTNIFLTNKGITKWFHKLWFHQFQFVYPPSDWYLLRYFNMFHLATSPSSLQLIIYFYQVN